MYDVLLYSSLLSLDLLKYMFALQNTERKQTTGIQSFNQRSQVDLMMRRTRFTYVDRAALMYIITNSYVNIPVRSLYDTLYKQ